MIAEEVRSLNPLIGLSKRVGESNDSESAEPRCPTTAFVNTAKSHYGWGPLFGVINPTEGGTATLRSAGAAGNSEASLSLPVARSCTTNLPFSALTMRPPSSPNPLQRNCPRKRETAASTLRSTFLCFRHIDEPRAGPRVSSAQGRAATPSATGAPPFAHVRRNSYDPYSLLQRDHDVVHIQRPCRRKRHVEKATIANLSRAL